MTLADIERELIDMIGPRMWTLTLTIAHECGWGGDLTIVERENEDGVADEAITFHAGAGGSAEAVAEVLLRSARMVLLGEAWQ